MIAKTRRGSQKTAVPNTAVESRSAPGRQNATRQAVDAILASLRSGRYRIGDRLPSEWDLVDHLGVGRSAVREAIRELSAVGLVTSRQGSGVYVQSLRADRLLTSSSFVEGDRVATKAELLEVRLIVEPGVAAIAAERATDEEIARLRYDNDRLLEAVTAGYRPPEDLGFHLDIVRAAHNASLLRVAAAIVSFYEAEEDLPTMRDVEEHDRIFAAIARRDPGDSANAMYDHLRTEQLKLEPARGFSPSAKAIAARQSGAIGEKLKVQSTARAAAVRNAKPRAS